MALRIKDTLSRLRASEQSIREEIDELSRLNRKSGTRASPPGTGEGAPPASPIFEAGDALLFDHLCLHRTGSRPEMDRVRYATETWCLAPSAFPDELVPIVV